MRLALNSSSIGQNKNSRALKIAFVILCPFETISEIENVFKTHSEIDTVFPDILYASYTNAPAFQNLLNVFFICRSLQGH